MRETERLIKLDKVIKEEDLWKLIDKKRSGE